MLTLARFAAATSSASVTTLAPSTPFRSAALRAALVCASDSSARIHSHAVCSGSQRMMLAEANSAATARRRILNLCLPTRPSPAPAMASHGKREFTPPPPPGDNTSVLQKKAFGGRAFVLNRPKVLNALDLEMIRRITPQLKAWDESRLCMIIMMTSSSPSRAFCAGGDVKSVISLVKAGEQDVALKFFEEEYRLNHLIATLAKPYVAILDGITMGGGVGLSMHGAFRIATENTTFSMPETAIGFFPDVGGSFFLPRMDGELGTYLGLTGQRLKGVDVFYAGIATHYVPSQRIGALMERLFELENDDPDVVNLAIEEFSEIPTTQPFSAVDGPDRVIVDRCFAHDSVERIIHELKKENTDFADKTVKQLESMSPTSLKITLAMLREGEKMTLQQCLQMEYHLVSLMLQDGDFAEGVTAVLVDKRIPEWNPKQLNDVQDKEVRRKFFMNLKTPELSFIRSGDFSAYPHRRFSGPSEDDVRQIVDGSSLAAGGNAWNAHDVEQFFAKASHWKHGVREKVRRVIARKCESDDEGWLRWKA